MSFVVPEALEAYARDRSQPFDPLMGLLAEETRARMEVPQMLSGELAGGVLRMLAKLVGARRVLEIGMFTGYGTLALADALPDDGEVHTLEIDEACVSLAAPYFARSVDRHKIRIHLGPARETLARLEGPFDLAFLDADKESYLHYYEEALRLLRPGGVLVVDNALWSGRVLDPDEPAAAAIDRLNRYIEADERVDRVLLTVRDGMFLVRKREG